MMDLFRSLARQERREAGLCPSSVQKFIDCLSQSCKDFGLTISIKKTNVDAQDASQAPSINIDEHTLNVVDEFTYLGSTISINLSLDTEINKHIGKASATIAKLTERVWKKHPSHTKHQGACLPDMHPLLYGSETWTTYMRQDHRLNTFCTCCLRRILDIRWQDLVPNNDILARTESPFYVLSPE